jgi:hypothetical protein
MTIETENQACPSCGQRYISVAKSGPCKLCLEEAIENELLDEEECDDDEEVTTV